MSATTADKPDQTAIAEKTMAMKAAPADLRPDVFLDSRQTADWLGVSEGWLRVLRVKGGGPPFRKIGVVVRYRVGDVLAWTDARTVTSTSQTMVAA